MRVSLQASLPSPTSPARRAVIDASLGLRSVPGIAASFLLVTLIVSVTSVRDTHPTAAFGLLGAFVILGAARLAVARSFDRVYPLYPERWGLAFRALALATAATWGLSVALWLRFMGRGNDTLIVLLSLGALAAGATSSLGPSLRLARAYVACLLVPSLAVLVLEAFDADGSQAGARGLALAFALYVAFLMNEAGHQSRNFAVGMEQNALLEAHSAELLERTRSLKLVLDTVGQGFLAVSLDGTMGDERSAILESWLGPSVPGEKIWDYIGRASSNAGGWLRASLEMLCEDIMPDELAMAQLPRRVAANGRELSIEYRPFSRTRADTAGSVATVPTVERHMLLILSDVTLAKEREQAESEHREMVTVFDAILRDRPGFLEFLHEAGEIMQRIADDAQASPEECRRWVHTLKGNAASFGLDTVAHACDALESNLAESGEEMSEAERGGLVLVWQSATDRIAAFLGNDRARIEITQEEYESLAHAISRAAPRVELARMVNAWTLEPLEVRFRRVAKQAQTLAHRLEKGAITVVMEPEGLRLTRELWAPFWASFIHLVRNAVDHGLERPAARQDLGKPETGTLTLRSFVRGESFVISVEDDGRGIDWSAVKEKAESLGLACDTQAELQAVLFADGMSTREEANEYSGRGVGLSALLPEVEKLRGRIELTTTPGRGTRWDLVFPAASMRSEERSAVWSDSLRPPMTTRGSSPRVPAAATARYAAQRP